MIVPPARPVKRARVLLIVGVFAAFFLTPYVIVAALEEVSPIWLGFPLTCVPAISAVLLAIYWLVVRRLLLKDYLAGLRLLESGSYREAVDAFDAHIRLMESRPRLDRIPWLALLDPLPYSHRERALIHKALAHIYLGETEPALEAYRRCVLINPSNEAARAVLALADSLADEPIRSIDEPVTSVD
jgi:tetratricopeptide (TPR) repeat protein